MVITYQQVFGVTNIGDELKEGQQVNFTPCPAVKSLRQLLADHSFFGGGNGEVRCLWDNVAPSFGMAALFVRSSCDC
jgi:hypothetical protein